MACRFSHAGSLGTCGYRLGHFTLLLTKENWSGAAPVVNPLGVLRLSAFKIFLCMPNRRSKSIVEFGQQQGTVAFRN